MTLLSACDKQLTMSRTLFYFSLRFQSFSGGNHCKHCTSQILEIAAHILHHYSKFRSMHFMGILCKRTVSYKKKRHLGLWFLQVFKRNMSGCSGEKWRAAVKNAYYKMRITCKKNWHCLWDLRYCTFIALCLILSDKKRLLETYFRNLKKRGWVKNSRGLQILVWQPAV